MNKRDYTISKKKNELWTCKVTDSYGSVSINYFKNVKECSKYIYYIWENEDVKVNKDDLMSNAIAECVKMDIERGVEPCLD